MCFGKWRVAPLTLGLAALLGMSLSGPTKADGWRLHPTLPKEVPAYDFNTGGEYFAPPVPYGHYAKDPVGQAAKAAGHVKGSLMGLGSHLGNSVHGLGHGDGGPHEGHSGLGHGHGAGLGNGCGFCSGKGLFNKHGGSGLGTGMAGHGHGHGHNQVVLGGVENVGRARNFGPYHPPGVVATSQALPTGQTIVMPAAQSACGQNGCSLGGLHSHLGGLANKLRCRLCGGNGCGPCGGSGIGDPCSNCQGSGHGLKGRCGSCGGCGLLSGLGKCMNCGGAGCANCLKGLGSKLHGLMGALHRPKFEWFVGPGGPVPMTPGYVPYIVTTRSPRDFFAFPPKNQDGF